MTAQLPLWATPPGRQDFRAGGGVAGAPGRRTTARAPIVCAGCGKIVARPKRGQRFCCGTCRYAVWDLKHPRKGAEAARRRDAGLARVEESGGDWMEEAGEELEELCACTTPGWAAPWEDFKADLLKRGLRHPHHPNCWGGLVLRAVKAGWLFRAGYTKATSPQSHGTEMRIYRVRG